MSHEPQPILLRQIRLEIPAPWPFVIILILFSFWPAARAATQPEPGRAAPVFEAGSSELLARNRYPHRIGRLDFEFLEAAHNRPAKTIQTSTTQSVEPRLILAPLPHFVMTPAATRPASGRDRSIQARRATEAPIIDGHISESAWEHAAVADRFWVSDQNRAPDEPTEVRVLFDAQTLYFAFRVFDRQTKRIEAQQAHAS